MNRWAEYKAGTLTPPVVVQHDEVAGEHLIWVYASAQDGILGPYSRRTYDETATLGEIVAVLAEAEEAANAEKALA